MTKVRVKSTGDGQTSLQVGDVIEVFDRITPAGTFHAKFKSHLEQTPRLHFCHMINSGFLGGGDFEVIKDD